MQLRRLRNFVHQLLGQVRSQGLVGGLVTMYVYYYLDLRYRVETRGPVPVDALDFDDDLKSQSQKYTPVNDILFRKVFKELGLPVGRMGFFDYGSGKGKPMILASFLGFSHVGGVELSQELVAVCRDNLRRLGLEGKADVFCEDAGAWKDIPPKFDVFFFCNPFKGEIMRRVLDNLEVSWRKHPRPMYLIYLNPVLDELVQAKGFEPILGIEAESYWYNDYGAAAYRYRPPERQTQP